MIDRYKRASYMHVHGSTAYYNKYAKINVGVLITNMQKQSDFDH